MFEERHSGLCTNDNTQIIWWDACSAFQEGKQIRPRGPMWTTDKAHEAHKKESAKLEESEQAQF